MLDLKYRSSGPIISQYLECPSFVSFIAGPLGSGKTTASIMKGMMCSGRQQKDAQGRRRSRAAIIRNTYPDLKTTTMKSWHEWFPKTFGKWQEDGPPTHLIHGADGLEAEIFFLALDVAADVRKLLSLELSWAWINEVREIDKSILDALTGRVGRFPVACVQPQIFGDTNMPDSDHWYYRLAELSRPDGWTFFRQPGGMDPGAENLEWLNQTHDSLQLPLGDKRRRDLGREYYIRTSQGKDPDWIKVYVDAQYGFVKEGKPVFPTYIDSWHCGLFELDERLPIFVGVDYGLTPAAVIGQRNAHGLWRVRHEIVSEDMDAVEFGERLSAFLFQKFQGWEIEEMTGDPSGDGRSGTDKNTPRKIMKAAELDIHPARTNDPIIRLGVVRKWLERSRGPEPGLMIHPDCDVLRKAMAGGYCMKRVQIVGKELYRDKPEKNKYSHVADALQYMLIGAGESVLMPKEIIRESAAKRRQLPMPEGEGAWMV